MSKSLGNHIGVTDPPEEIYGKTLSLPDEAMATWYDLLLGDEPAGGRPPRDAKRALARRLVARFHDEHAAEQAEQRFDRVHIARRAPEDLPTSAFRAAGGRPPARGARRAFGVSRSEARRLLAGGGVRLDGEPVADDRPGAPARRDAPGRRAASGGCSGRPAEAVEDGRALRPGLRGDAAAGRARSASPGRRRRACFSARAPALYHVGRRVRPPRGVERPRPRDARGRNFPPEARRSLKTRQHAHLRPIGLGRCASRFDPSLGCAFARGRRRPENQQYAVPRHRGAHVCTGAPRVGCGL